MEEKTFIYAIHGVFAAGLAGFGAYRILALDDPGGLVNVVMGLGVVAVGVFIARQQ